MTMTKPVPNKFVHLAVPDYHCQTSFQSLTPELEELIRRNSHPSMRPSWRTSCKWNHRRRPNRLLWEAMRCILRSLVSFEIHSERYLRGPGLVITSIVASWLLQNTNDVFLTIEPTAKYIPQSESAETRRIQIVVLIDLRPNALLARPDQSANPRRHHYPLRSSRKSPSGVQTW